jgi:hypothetical protein
MTLSEILLIIAIVALLIIPSILNKRIRQPLNTYVNLTIGLLLLILVWFFTGEGSLPLRIIITTVVIKSTIKTIKEYKEFSGLRKEIYKN